MKSTEQQTRRITAAIGLIALVVCGLVATRRSPSAKIASGHFHQVAHKGTGTAAIFRFANGQRTLRLTDFQTYPASDLEVRLIAAADAFDNETVEKSDPIDLGPLQTTEGDQSFTLPSHVDLTTYRAVTIWSVKYGVNFTTAPLALR